MKKVLLFLMAMIACGKFARAEIQLGIDVLAAHHFDILQNKRVGLVTNHSGVNNRGTKTRLILKSAPGVKLVALFTPEHGLDGTELAGKYVATRRDKLTGLIAYSLYGPTRKPTPQMLAGLDALVFDMQDIGSRSYTYVSTMVKCMEAAGEHGIEMIVLDRPNPLGGLRVEGPPIESQWISFVGQVPVPAVHGMTIGEIARMANGLGWVQPRCNLKVVPMQGWKRDMVWTDTGLRWVATSPNIPRPTSPLYYVATGTVGELPDLETGVGGPVPFEIVGAKWLDARGFTAQLKAQHFPGVAFSEFTNGGLQGTRLFIDPHAGANLCAISAFILDGVNQPATPSLFVRSASKLEMFYKCYGSESIRTQINRRAPVQKIVASWQPSVSRFERDRQPFLLY
jgi:uncharacterized protein YbbC (DUF1343 family)